jgi:KaiC/GvpD/RAD55 family RecA-like ATPase
MPLTLNNVDITDLLTQKYNISRKGWIILMQIPIEQSMEVNIESIRVLQGLGYEGIYITLSKDYKEISALLQKEGIDMSKMVFIDGISQMYGTEKIESPSVTYVQGPLSIDAISEAVEESIGSMKSEKKFVLLDSITTVLLYNSLQRTVQFSRFLTEVLRRLHVTGVVVSVSKGFANEKLLKELSEASDEVINLQ